MSTQSLPRPVAVDELKRAWRAVTAGEFRTGNSGCAAPGGRRVPDGRQWSPAPGEHSIVVLGCTGSAGASTLALATALAAAPPVRVLECCSASASGLASAATAELGDHSPGWRHGKRDHVMIQRATDILGSPDQVPFPSGADHENLVSILDIGWEVGQLLTTECWLADAVRRADQLTLVTTATVPGIRRATTALELLAEICDLDQVTLAVRGPRRKRWRRGLEQSGGPALRRVLAGDQLIEVPNASDLAVHGLDSRPFPAVLTTAARLLLPATHRANTSERA